tara:strand:- start:544 stop:648 length:105 start_codon:yes stop_codon:yes gene_type:complete
MELLTEITQCGAILAIIFASFTGIIRIIKKSIKL